MYQRCFETEPEQAANEYSRPVSAGMVDIVGSWLAVGVAVFTLAFLCSFV